MKRPVPSPLGGAELAFPAIQQACADAGVPLRDRYGWAFPTEWVVRAVKAARTGRSLKAGVQALDEEMWLKGLELCPEQYDVPADDLQLRILVRVLRSPVAYEAILMPCGTPAAFRRHKRHGEEPCEACREAENLYHRGGRPKPVLRPCGTPAAYARHQKAGEPADAACLAAHAARVRKSGAKARALRKAERARAVG